MYPKIAVCEVRCRSTAPKKPGAVLKRPLGETPRKIPSDATGQRAPKKRERAGCAENRGIGKTPEKSTPSEREELAARPLRKKRATAAPPGKRCAAPRSAVGFCQKRIKALLIIPAHHPTVKSRIKDLNVGSVLRKPREKPRYPSHGTKKPERGEPGCGECSTDHQTAGHRCRGGCVAPRAGVIGIQQHACGEQGKGLGC